MSQEPNSNLIVGIDRFNIVKNFVISLINGDIRIDISDRTSRGGGDGSIYINMDKIIRSFTLPDIPEIERLQLERKIYELIIMLRTNNRIIGQTQPPKEVGEKINELTRRVSKLESSQESTHKLIKGIRDFFPKDSNIKE